MSTYGRYGRSLVATSLLSLAAKAVLLKLHSLPPCSGLITRSISARGLACASRPAQCHEMCRSWRLAHKPQGVALAPPLLAPPLLSPPCPAPADYGAYLEHLPGIREQLAQLPTYVELLAHVVGPRPFPLDLSKAERPVLRRRGRGKREAPPSSLPRSLHCICILKRGGTPCPARFCPPSRAAAMSLQCRAARPEELGHMSCGQRSISHATYEYSGRAFPSGARGLGRPRQRPTFQSSAGVRRLRSASP